MDSTSRIEALRGFLAEDPEDSFSRYALAMEHAKLDDLDAAIGEFEALVRRDPSYVATYYQLAKAYERAERPSDAERTYRDGITVAAGTGDNRTRDELAAALELLLG